MEGTGPIREIHAQADARGNLRGYVANPRPDLDGGPGVISFSKTIGAGFLTVRKDTGMKDPYTSVIPLQVGEVAMDVAYYLATSEQIPSALIIALTIEKDGSISSSGGILIQTFPDTPEDAIITIEQNIASLQGTIGTSLKEGMDIESVLISIFNGEQIRVLGEHTLRASCRCSRSVILRAFQGISIEELKDMRDKDKGAEATCTFCARKYHFTEKDLDRVIAGAKDHPKAAEPESSIYN
jgi:molecular chaperone Hsp33